MDFEYTEEQRMLADSLRRYAGQGWTQTRRRAAEREGKGFDEGNWTTLAELGVLGLTVPAEAGGFGEGPASLLPVHLELGRALSGEPVIPSAVVSAAILSQHGSAEQQQRWLPAIASGEAIVSLGYLERDRRFAAKPAKLTASAQGEGVRLNGEKVLVWHGAAAHAWIVSAADADGAASLYLVPADTAGVTVNGYPTIDGVRAADLVFKDVDLPADARIGASGQGEAGLETGLDHGIAALAAHAAGAMERLVEITVDYLRQRKQFGVPLAKFQSLQHRVAEMVIQKELAMSMACVAVAALTEEDAARRRRMVAGAKVVVAQAGRFIGQEAVQLHGGMGMTDELEVGDYFKRLTMVNPIFGDVDYQTARFSEAMQ